MRSRSGGTAITFKVDWTVLMSCRCDTFNKAYNHISDKIDQVVHKDLKKGKASPMRGVAYPSLDDNEVCPGLC